MGIDGNEYQGRTGTLETQGKGKNRITQVMSRFVHFLLNCTWKQKSLDKYL